MLQKTDFGLNCWANHFDWSQSLSSFEPVTECIGMEERMSSIAIEKFAAAGKNN